MVKYSRRSLYIKINILVHTEVIMVDVKRRAAIKEFVSFWNRDEKISERQCSQIFWVALLNNLFGVEHPEYIVKFEEEVVIEHVSFMDCFINNTKVLIEQKSSDVDLKKPILQSDGSLLTPFQQALRYRTYATYSNSPRWIVISNFKEFDIHDMENPSNPPEVIYLKDLENEYHRLAFLVDMHSEHIRKEEELSLSAGEIVGQLYDALLEQYVDKTSDKTLKSLNKLCVRLVFCLYAEDAGIFGERDMFLKYMTQFEAKHMRKALIELFKVLATEKRDPYLNDDLAAFPYVNGGLFSGEDIEIPNFTDEIRDLLLTKASANFNWSEISPTIFGAVFESTLNPETRHSGGMHFTSIENIHKVIDPLFMDDLKKEFDEICCYKNPKILKENLSKFQDKIANLTFLDPACGSGNFLTETYISLRKIENDIISRLGGKDQTWLVSPIKVSINQFYGIEINDFAVTVAKTALWIAETQMKKKTEYIINQNLKFFPLESNSNIVENNALRLNWEDVVPKNKLSYIIGNPPFLGKKLQSNSQKYDMKSIFSDKWEGYKELDYVAAWYKKASDLMYGTNIRTALVSTNSITQGEQVPILWRPLIDSGIHINFAYRTFRWDSEANIKAHVHCVIIGFSYINNNKNKLFYDDKVSIVNNINAYLIDGDNIFVTKRSEPLCDCKKMVYGNEPREGNNLILTPEQKDELLKETPSASEYIKPFANAKSYINSKPLFCLWLKNADLSKIRASKFITERLKQCKIYRENSKQKQAHASAVTPYLFTSIRQPQSNYLLIPISTGSSRTYIPFDYNVSKDLIVSNACFTMENADLYHFGILMSIVHMLWARTVGGKLKSDFRYSNTIIYNNFPWCNPSEKQKLRIEKNAQNIINIRKTYETYTLDDLYSELYMPEELRKAHQENDKAVMEAYGFYKKVDGERVAYTETEIITTLFKMYQKLSDKTK